MLKGKRLGFLVPDVLRFGASTVVWVVNFDKY